ncbi:hypothetical protein H4I95_10717 [Botrytis cinerea]
MRSEPPFPSKKLGIQEDNDGGPARDDVDENHGIPSIPQIQIQVQAQVQVQDSQVKAPSSQNDTMMARRIPMSSCSKDKMQQDKICSTINASKCSRMGILTFHISHLPSAINQFHVQ